LFFPKTPKNYLGQWQGENQTQASLRIGRVGSVLYLAGRAGQEELVAVDCGAVHVGRRGKKSFGTVARGEPNSGMFLNAKNRK